MNLFTFLHLFASISIIAHPTSRRRHVSRKCHDHRRRTYSDVDRKILKKGGIPTHFVSKKAENRIIIFLFSVQFKRFRSLLFGRRIRGWTYQNSSQSLFSFSKTRVFGRKHSSPYERKDILSKIPMLLQKQPQRRKMQDIKRIIYSIDSMLHKIKPFAFKLLEYWKFACCKYYLRK